MGQMHKTHGLWAARSLPSINDSRFPSPPPSAQVPILIMQLPHIPAFPLYPVLAISHSPAHAPNIHHSLLNAPPQYPPGSPYTTPRGSNATPTFSGSQSLHFQHPPIAAPWPHIYGIWDIPLQNPKHQSPQSPTPPAAALPPLLVCPNTPGQPRRGDSGGHLVNDTHKGSCCFGDSHTTFFLLLHLSNLLFPLSCPPGCSWHPFSSPSLSHSVSTSVHAFIFSLTLCFSLHFFSHPLSLLFFFFFSHNFHFYSWSFFIFSFTITLPNNVGVSSLPFTT